MNPVTHLFRTNTILKIQKCFAHESHGRHSVTMLTGEGIGQELMGHVQDVFCHAEVPVDFDAIHVCSKKDVDKAIESIKKNKTAIKSNIQNMKDEDGITILPEIMMRKKLDLYFNIVKYQSYCNIETARHEDVDIIVVRQNTEGEYSLLEHECVPGVVECLKIITRKNTDRVAKKTFQYATAHKRKKVTIISKANIMKLSDGLFLEHSKKVAKKFPDIKHDAMIVDNCCMQLTSNPKQFDVMVMPNLYGSIVGNIMCGLLGGPGLFAGSNYGEKYAVFEPSARKMATSLVGKDSANPVAMLNASVLLLCHLGLANHANTLQKAIYKTLCEDQVQTADLGGSNCCSEFIEQLKENIDSMSSKKDDC